ncbi:ERAD-associated E3 ubiquitin-protein ligase component HRD3A-like [Nymphaea colorata]|nr:ERAD-associated E3 ubiquitin-protein ligase component HRD3A-like [Nymphaea colorata]
MHRAPWVLRLLILSLLLLSAFPLSSLGRHLVLILENVDPKGDSSPPSDDEASGDNEPAGGDSSAASNWDDFAADLKPDEDLDPGSWRLVFDSDPVGNASIPADDALYFSSVRQMVNAAAAGDLDAMDEAVAAIDEIARRGHAHAQSVMGFLHGAGCRADRSASKAFTYHYFAAEGGNPQSKMALAYTYFRQEMYDKSVKLYGELAETALASFLISKDSPVVDQVRINDGAEENKEALRKLRGEEDDDFQITEYQAQKGSSAAMYKLGFIYYFGLRGVRRDHAKALSWFLKAVDKGEPRSMELLGEIYARGAGVEKNYTKALEWLRLAAKQRLISAYNGIGYLYVKGYGVEKKNYTKAKEYFERAAKHDDPSGHYNLGVLYLKGIGVKKSLADASRHFIAAANYGQPKAYYQLGKMFQKGVGVEKNLAMATTLYKSVAERGPWGSLSRWALESYLKGEIGKAFFIYSRMAEMGYEVAQSSAAWILDRYGERSLCMGEAGFCTNTERHQRAHSLWWHASEQGNEHAALLIGDAYYYGRGTDRDYERAAEAYAHSKLNAQAMFNLGYMHEHGEGLPYDLHLAKRYYDQALDNERAAKLPVMLALFSVWIRMNYPDTILVDFLDSLPRVCPKVAVWIQSNIMDEGNATILTLFVCLITVLYLRERQRRQLVALHPEPENVVN